MHPSRIFSKDYPDLFILTSFIFDQDLEAIKARVREMEEEALKLKELQSEVDKQMTGVSGVSSPQHHLDRTNSSGSLTMSYEERE